jgi:hypothetical protein
MPFRKGEPPQVRMTFTGTRATWYPGQELDPKWVPAKFDGRCSDCGRWFTALYGFQIQADEQGGWRGECCDPERGYR